MASTNTARKRILFFALFAAVTAAVFAVDRAAKILAIANLRFGEAVVVLPGLLEWQLTRNTGMALGIFAGHPALISVLPVAVVGIGWLALRRYHVTQYMRICTALILGGFLGNLVDRIAMGFVLDMVYFPWMPWYVCNPADIAICFGVAMLAVSLLARPQDWVLKKEATANETNRPDGGA
ncbi:MAG: signal peptidase II [Eubacteriales bacterium]|nr:signal peptidase II [Eubacteriales bacterium]